MTPVKRLRHKLPRRVTTLFGLLAACWVAQAVAQPAQHFPAESVDFFESNIRPLLMNHCGECHGAKVQQGGLRVDSRQALLTGGDTAAAVIPGDNNSLLLQAIRREGNLQMPPDKPLSQQQRDLIEQWVKLGAPWPAASTQPLAPPVDSGRNHWAFQPVARHDLPALSNADWVQTPVDVWIAQKHQSLGIIPAIPADRRTLIRRVSYALTGLPPSSEEVSRFVTDANPDAYASLVARLLASKSYGEHWGRRWLDVARYSDTKGYVYAREERHWTHAWTYRDWVVDSLNADLPYDRFLLLQIAADQVKDAAKKDLAAMGFLTLGRRFLGVRRDVIDDRIDTVCRGTMGLTVSCARCHDHKYDPIPTADYYSLYGVFDSCVEDQQVLADHLNDQAFREELEKRQTTLRDKLQSHRHTAHQRARDRLADYLFAQTELHKFPADGFDQIFQSEDLLPAFVRQWENYLRKTQQTADPIFTLWHAYAALETNDFASAALAVFDRIQQSQTPINSHIAKAFAAPAQSFKEVCERYAEVFASMDSPDPREDPEAEALRQVLHGDRSPCRVPDGPISQCETFFDSNTVTELWKLQGEVDRWLINAPAIPVALSLVDQAHPVAPCVFRRGNPLKLGEEVPRQFLELLSGSKRQPFQIGSGRLELAQAIVHSDNPLTARVLVNRVWTHHFGTGLVSTPSDFGLRAAPPSHPELLDWLAAEFMRSGWSLKQLHRLIVLSSTFQQSSTLPTDNGSRKLLLRADPENRLLWRFNPRRLTFEEVRDSMLRVTGSLDETRGGKPANLFAAPFPLRRTLYGLVDRQYFASTLRVFDFANPDLHVAQRSETTVPQQALFFMNHPLVIERAKTFAKIAREEVSSSDDPIKSIHRMYQRAYQREPTQSELLDAQNWLNACEEVKLPELPPTAKDWSYGFGSMDETNQKVQDFVPLPHFSGSAWQGGPAWPDGKLGWVQLTATGGHPGNDRAHAAIRRWTAPQAMTTTLRSKLTHEAAPGDGIRAFIVSSTQGVLQSTSVHQKSEDLNMDRLSVQPGETLDFVVDIDKVLNSDQYLWHVTIASDSMDQTTSVPIVWDSKTDFPPRMPNSLDRWEQMAQVILCSNEFLFID